MVKTKKFKPVAHYNQALDWFVYLERDCSYVAEPTPNSNIVLFRDGNDVVGFRIENFSQVIGPWFLTLLQNKGPS